MQIEILEDNQEEIKFKITGKEDHHSIGNLLRNEAFNDKAVTFAAYTKTHPLKEESVFIIKTSGKKAKTVLKEVLKNLTKQLSEFKEELKGL